MEISPLAWLHSVMLYTIGIGGLGFTLLYYLRGTRRQTMLWGLWSAGFFLLAVDERFALHERLRDQLLSPKGVKLPIFFWTRPGDFLILIAFVAGIAFTVFFIRRIRPLATKPLLTALCIAGLAVLLDSIPFEDGGMQWLYRMQVAEETLETLAFSSLILFLISQAALLMNSPLSSE